MDCRTLIEQEAEKCGSSSNFSKQSRMKWLIRNQLLSTFKHLYILFPLCSDWQLSSFCFLSSQLLIFVSLVQSCILFPAKELLTLFLLDGYLVAIKLRCKYLFIKKTQGNFENVSIRWDIQMLIIYRFLGFDDVKIGLLSCWFVGGPF